MHSLTESQQSVLNFILSRWEAGEALPSCREIAGYSGWSSPKAATDTLETLKRKGYLDGDQSSSRRYRLTQQSMGLPVLGDIPAGCPVEVLAEQCDTLPIIAGPFGVRDRRNAFFLRARGDSMIGRHIFDGDLVLIEKEAEPKVGDVVAALLDNESTLKTLVWQNGRHCLRSENPDFPDFLPCWDLQIQGVARGLVRRLST